MKRTKAYFLIAVAIVDAISKYDNNEQVFNDRVDKFELQLNHSVVIALLVYFPNKNS